MSGCDLAFEQVRSPQYQNLHNHFMVFENKTICQAPLADENNPNLTDSGQNGLFLQYLSDVYLKFLDVLDLEILIPISPSKCRLKLTGYPQGLPSWEVKGGIEAVASGKFWHEYDFILHGFLDFYRTFFALVSSGETQFHKNAAFPNQINDILLVELTSISGTAQLGNDDEIRQEFLNSP